MTLTGTILVVAGGVAFVIPLVAFWIRGRPRQRGPVQGITRVKDNVDQGTVETHGPGPTDAEKKAKGT